ncbi:hypothetical protein FOZ63_004351, partial [Perkinsus olseni]
ENDFNHCIDTTSVRRVEIYLDYYVDRVSESECLIDGLERLTLVAELTLKFNPRRVGSADLATKVSTMFSGLSKLDFICDPREHNVPPRRALKFSKAESTLKAFDTLARRNKHSLIRLTLRCDPDLRVTTFPVMPRLRILTLQGRISRAACLMFIQRTELEIFIYLREDSDPNIWTIDDVDTIFRSMAFPKFKCLALSSVRPPESLLWSVSRMLKNPGILWLVRPVGRSSEDGTLYRSQVTAVNIGAQSPRRTDLLDRIVSYDDDSPFSLLCHLFDYVPYNAVAKVWGSDMTEKDRDVWSREVSPRIRGAIASYKQPNTQGCTQFVSNTFKKEKCRDCGLLWNYHEGIIDEGLLAQFRKRASPVPKASPVGVSAKQLKEEKRNALLAKKKAAQQPKDDWFFSGAPPSSSPTLRPVMGQSQSATTFDLPDQHDVDDEDDDFKFFSGEALRARQQSEPVLRPPSNVGMFKCVNLLDMEDLVGEDVVTQPSSSQVTRRGTPQELSDPALDKDPYNTSMSTNDIESPTLVASSPSVLSHKAAPLPGGDGTPLGEKVFLLEQRLRDAQAEKEIAVDIVKDELAQEKSRSVELSSTVESQAKVIGELNLKLKSLEIGASTNTNERERLAQLDHSLKELERKSKAEAEVSATRLAQLENELSVRESEMNGLREAAAEAKSEVDELRRLAEDTGALRQQEDKLVSDYRERIEGLQERARAVPDLKAEVAALTTRASELSTALHTRDEEARKQEHLVEEQRSRTARLESRVEQLQLSLGETSARAESFQQVAERDAALCQQLRCQLREQEEQSAQSQQELKECQVRIAQLQADTAAIEGLKNTAAEAESNIRQLKDRNEQQEEKLEQRKCFRISGLSSATHAEELEKLSTEKAAQTEAMEEKLRTADNEIQRHKEEMKGIRSQLAHGLKVEKELLQTRAALEESKKTRDEQAEELASKAKAVAAYEEENARLSSRSADLEQRVQGFESSGAELRAMHEKARAEGVRQLEEIEALRKRTDQQQIDLEISKKALADSERKLEDVAGPAYAVEDLKACLAVRESEIADLKSHIEKETSAREAEKEQIRVANASEMEGLRRTLETAYTSEKAQMRARLSEAKDELARLQKRHDSATAELDALRAAAAADDDATAEDLSKMQSSTLESVLADQQLCFNKILAALQKASLSSQGLAYSTTLGPPPQASFGGSIPTGVSSVPGSPDPEMAWYTEDEEFLPKRRSSLDRNNHPVHAATSANVYSMNDEVERIDTAAAAVPHDPTPQDGVMISRRVSEVVERLIEQLREAQRGRLRIESELEECQRELDLRRAEAARPYFAEVLRCRWPFNRADAPSNRTTHSSELRNLVSLRDLEVGIVRDRPNGRARVSSSHSEESG